MFLMTYSLDLSSIIGQPGGKGSSGVPLLIKPTHLLTKHCPKRQTTQPGREVLTRHTETDHLGRRKVGREGEGERQRGKSRLKRHAKSLYQKLWIFCCEIFLDSLAYAKIKRENTCAILTIIQYRVRKLFNAKIIAQNIRNLQHIIVLYLLQVYAAGTFLPFLWF